MKLRKPQKPERFQYLPRELPRGHRETEQKSEIYSPTRQIWEEKEGLGRILEHKILKNLNQKIRDKADIEDCFRRRAEKQHDIDYFTIQN